MERNTKTVDKIIKFVTMVHSYNYRGFDIIHHPVFYLKHSFGDRILSPEPQ
jgi:hypothetical protein